MAGFKFHAELSSALLSKLGNNLPCGGHKVKEISEMTSHAEDMDTRSKNITLASFPLAWEPNYSILARAD